MKKKLPICVLIFVFSFFYTGIGMASETLPWSTTYDCGSYWEQGMTLSCDGLSKAGDWVCDNGTGTNEKEQIIDIANNPGGGGGYGQRHWEGDGWTNNSGGTKINFASPQPELWVRWYERFELGFAWQFLTTDKLLYFDPGTAMAVVPHFQGMDKVNIWTMAEGNHPSVNGYGWQSIMGSDTGDGQWHFFEVHLKMDTNGSDGIAEMWVGGVKALSYTNVNFGTQPGWTSFLIGSNQRDPLNNRCMAVDYDDVAVNNTGYIGPISDSIAPDPPSSLQTN